MMDGGTGEASASPEEWGDTERGELPAPEEADMDGDAWSLFSDLKAWRDRKADAQQVPHYAILQDATLRAIAVRRPANDDAMLAIPGMGPVRLERYGAALFAIVRQAQQERMPASA